MEGDIHQGIRYCAQHLINTLQSLTLNILREKFPRNQNICWLKSKENKIKMKPRWEVPNASELEACVERKGGVPSQEEWTGLGRHPTRSQFPYADKNTWSSSRKFEFLFLAPLTGISGESSRALVTYKRCPGDPCVYPGESSVMEKVALIYMRIVQSFPFWMDEDLFFQNSLSLQVLAKVLC